MRIGNIENDFLEVKMGLREIIETITPEESDNLDNLLNSIDKLVRKAILKKVKDDENM